MDNQKSEKQLLFESNRRLQEVAQELSIAKKERERLLDELSVKNVELKDALNKVQKQTVRLMQAAKMAALGVFAGGVAHELNNPLMAVLNYIQFCLKHLDKESQLYKVLQDAEHETKRCAKVIKTVLTFSRLKAEGEEDPVETDCYIIVKRILELLAYRIEANEINVKVDFPDQGLVVTMKPSKIQQATLNIFLNALDAVQVSKDKEIVIAGKYEGDYAVIVIADKGCGIEEKDMEKLFDPFFTTKEAGKSVGMGLPIAKQIIDDHQGELIYESELGVGTKVKILLPLKKGYCAINLK